MSSVLVTTFNRLFDRYDVDGSGKLSRQEIAKGALALLSVDATRTEGSLFATFVQGGKKGTGLLPDFDGDRLITKDEVAKFAAYAGNTNRIAADDFKAAFPNDAVDGGTDVNLDRLRRLAGESTTTPPTDDSGSGGKFEIGDLLKKLLPMLLFGGQGGGFGGQPGGFGGGLQGIFGLIMMLNLFEGQK